MEIQTELLNTAHERLSADFHVLKIGELAKGDTLAMAITGGSVNDVYLNKSECRHLTVKFLSRDRVQATAYDTCCAISNKLRTITKMQLSQGQWTHTEVTTEPQEVGVISGAHVYACVARLHYMTI